MVKHVIQSEYNEVYSLIEGSRQMDKTAPDRKHEQAGIFVQRGKDIQTPFSQNRPNGR